MPASAPTCKLNIASIQSTASNAEEQIKALGKCPKEPTSGENAMLWFSLQSSTLLNRETNHLAELMIQGSNMGIISLTKVLNSFRTSGKDPSRQAYTGPE